MKNTVIYSFGHAAQHHQTFHFSGGRFVWEVSTVSSQRVSIQEGVLQSWMGVFPPAQLGRGGRGLRGPLDQSQEV